MLTDSPVRLTPELAAGEGTLRSGSPTSAAAPSSFACPPWWYDVRGFFILQLSYRGSLWSQIRFFDNNIRERHMEVAVGTGTLLKMILLYRRLRGRPVTSLVGVDYSERMLSGARRRFAGWPGVSLRQGDVTRLSDPDASFDSVNVANAFHCFTEPQAALAEIRRVLAPGGTLAMNVLLHPRGFRPLRSVAERINAWGMRKGILVTPYDRDRLLEMVRGAGFEIRREVCEGNACSLVAVKATG